ncbi:hypothetical protein D3C73_1189000 [compost metagenome]
MARRSKGPRLYLRKGRADRRSDDVWVIRDGQKEVSTGCASGRLEDAEQALAEYLAAKWTPDAIGSDRRASDPADILVTEILALYAMEKAPRVADPVSCQGPVAAERILGRHDAPVSSAIRRSLARGRRRPHSR